MGNYTGPRDLSSANALDHSTARSSAFAQDQEVALRNEAVSKVGGLGPSENQRGVCGRWGNAWLELHLGNQRADSEPVPLLRTKSGTSFRLYFLLLLGQATCSFGFLFV